MNQRYIKLDLEAIRRDFPEVYAKWSDTHEVTPILLEEIGPTKDESK